ncbi:MAG: efflux transporter, family, subunit [Firmicutes bacterium]|nr:efflux transporter, family, subunit [Bacillota bacterium]
MNKIPVPAKYLPAVVLAVVLAAVLLGISYIGTSSSTNMLSRGSVSVTTAPISMINKPLEITLPGSVQSRQAVIISAEIPGCISELNAKEGELVKAGQQLVHIDGAGEQVIVDAPAGTSVSPNADAQANYDKLAREYERYQKLYQVGGIARKQFEEMTARLQAARDALQIGSVPGSSSQSQQAGSANLTAPISGKVTGLSATVGQTVQPGQQLMVLDTGGDVRGVVHLEQKDLYLIQAGTPVEIFLENSGQQSIPGQVEAIYPEAGTGTPSFLAHIRIDNANGLLTPGMAVTAHLKTGQSTPVRAVPNSAIIQDQENTYLYLVIDDKIVKQQVTVGAIIGAATEITSALPEQAIVIISGMQNLKEGDVVPLP